MAKILFVDDEVELSEIYKRRLEIVGHKVLIAATIEEGKAIYDSESPDEVIFDYLFPGDKNSKVLFDYIREKDKNMKKHTPLILLSGAVGTYIKFDFDPDKILMKPFDYNDLCKVIDELLKNKTGK